MKNFQSIEALFWYVNERCSSALLTEAIDLTNPSPSELLFTANKELKDNGQLLYGLPIKKITVLPLEKAELLVAIHLYFEPTTSLLPSIITDIGDYEIAGYWGIGVGTKNESEPKIYSWRVKAFQVSLRKYFQSIKDYELLPTQDVVTISTDAYEKRREALLHK